MVDRQLLWYRHSKDIPPETHYWNFLIVNTPFEISGIKQKIYQQLRPIIDETTIADGVIKRDSRLTFELFCLETTQPDIDFQRVYQGKAKEDRRLRPRKTLKGWNNLVENVASGKI